MVVWAIATGTDRPADQGRPPAYLEHEHAVPLLKKAFHRGHRAVNDAIRAFGVTPTQMGALNRLVAEPGLSGAELARRMLVTPQAAQLALAALEQRGLVERRPDERHGRIIRSYLTAKGDDLVGSCMALGLAAEDRFLSPLSAEERATLARLLTRLAHNGAYPRPPAPDPDGDF